MRKPYLNEDIKDNQMSDNNLIKDQVNIWLLRNYHWIQYWGETLGLTIAACLTILFNSSCKKLIEVNPPYTAQSQNMVYSSDATAAAVLTGIYTNISISPFSAGGFTSLSLFPGLSSDELTLYGAVTDPNYIQYYKNSLTNSLSEGYSFWSRIYPVIFVTNSAIDGLTKSNELTPSVKQQLLGEAKFIRAFCYFYLVNLYGDVPLVLGLDYKTNATLSRSQQSLIYEQIISDLKEAQTNLSTEYLSANIRDITTERVRPTKWSAAALLARTYLYNGEWANAEIQSTIVINNSNQFELASLNTTFLKSSTEAIWQLQPVNIGENTQDARVFVLPESGPNEISYPVYISKFLLNKFENNDQRKTKWIDSVVTNGRTYYFPYKYKIHNFGDPVSEYNIVLRLAEQYLIRAEARAHQDNLTGAIHDLNAIRVRAGLPNTPANSKSQLLSAILHERETELFTEWGHRWIDLKRTGSIDSIMSIVTSTKGGTWNSNWQLYPIPLTELQTAPNVKQNTGY